MVKQFLIHPVGEAADLDMTPKEFVLHHTLVHSEGEPKPLGWLIFLHGIFGMGRNWQGIARRLVRSRPEWGAVLVDLRMHGQSQGAPPPHTVEACARDLETVARRLPGPTLAVSGHSFGGKVALRWAADRGERLARVWVLDADPGVRRARGRDVPTRVLEVMESVSEEFPSRRSFRAELTARGLDARTADWLGTNLVRKRRRRFRLQLHPSALRVLLRDHQNQDLWSVLETPPTDIHVVLAGRSLFVPDDARRRFHRLSRRSPSRLRVHTIASAGHWLHVDEPDRLLSILRATLP